MKGLIYVATNRVNGKQYVGQTMRKFEVRQGQHIQDSENNRDNTHFHSAIRKHGQDNFKWAIIVEGVDNMDSLNRLEQYWIEELDTFKNGYNSTSGGENCIVSDEARRKMSEAKKGEKNPNWNKHLSPEAIKKMSEANKNVWKDEEYKKKMSEAKKGGKNPNWGKHHTPEAIKKLSEANKGEKAPNWGKFGAKHPRSKPVYQLDKLTEEITARFAGVREAERQTGVANPHISKVCKGKQKTAGGFKWCYVEDYKEVVTNYISPVHI
ncbi:NUMOD3 domain-containing DNA-binding protein [Clostridium tyrobutyricum]|uniref:NUMOD3 domain-containing DNA-binding protein n=1 Tax=Clostridium tyrobutyricum TaxID=1519 RepID=UPI0030D055D5